MDKKEIEQKRSEKSIGGLSLGVHRDFTRRLIEKLKKYGYDSFTPSQILLVRFIPLEGIRQGLLTEQAGISKQSVAELIEELVKKGCLKRVKDTKDLRAKKICFTETGKKLLVDGMEAVKEVRSEYIEIVGEEALLIVENVLRKILEKVKV